jgi:hypothetical protein
MSSLSPFLAAAVVLFLGWSQQRIIRYILHLLGVTLPLPPQMKLSKKAQNQQQVFHRPMFGAGIKELDPSNWRNFLFSDRSPQEMLEEVRDTLMMDLSERELTLGQMTEGVRRCTGLQFWPKATVGDEYWSEAQCREVALALCRENGLTPKQDTGKASPAAAAQEGSCPSPVSSCV